MMISEMTNAEAQVAVSAVLLTTIKGGARAIGEKKMNAKALLNEVIAQGLSDRTLSKTGYLQGCNTKQGVNAYRVIDACLQKMRKQGLITYVGGEWVAA